jgi:mono/diheme cytochrome c family protein
MMRLSAALLVRLRRLLLPWHFLLALCLLLPTSSWAKRDPEVLYMMECQGCHLADGSGEINSIPTLHNNIAKFPAVPGGREYLVQVPGVASSSLSDQEITAVLNWMLTKFGPAEWTRRYTPYTVEEVTVLRKQPLTETGSRRAELVLLMKNL